ncbi:TonB-dependent receptor [Roseimarinus sediminis]|uniref:TonB-dependent receptor n=1 Tax=Roseimarinus sediminis TaxID=1610899 RepID=UPI003D1B4F9E
MSSKQALSLFLLLLSSYCYAQQRVVGLVKDADNGELLIGATVFSEASQTVTATNANGYFSILCNGDSLSVSFVGYQTQRVKCVGERILNIHLKPGQSIDEISVIAQSVNKFNSHRLSVKEIKLIPALGGTPDLLKTLQLLPGIQSQAEGTSHMNVRGGNPGENLYLLDDVPLIYINHLGGFMSVFNPDMINNIEVYKGGFPAKYGGKLSSIVAINQKEGNINDWKGSLGLGISDASFSIEGPLMDKKASLIVTGRKTLIDYPMMLLSMLVDQDFVIYYGFHDINAKFSYRPNSKNSYHINLYQGDDYLNYQSDFKSRKTEFAKIKNSWGNWMLSGRWSRVLNPRLFVNNILSTTNYRLKVVRKFTTNSQQNPTNYRSRYLSRVNNLSFRSDWQYKVNIDYSIYFGGMSSLVKHVPNKIETSDYEQEYFEKIRSFENVFYLSNQYCLWNLFDLDLGFRFVNYMNHGFSKTVLEPRINIDFTPHPTQSINFNYQIINQFSHLLLTSGAILNNEIWVPADEKLEPSQSRQYSLGWKSSIKNDEYIAELNVYYKYLNHLATYKEGYSNLLGDGGWRNKIETEGSGKSKGLELLIKKNKGTWTGFIAYTYSKTTRRFEKINKGQEFIFTYDRPHSASINLSRKLSDKCTASFTWVYQTGLPYTPVIGRQNTFNLINAYNRKDIYNEALIYGKRNSSRMQDYHRLDIGLNYKLITKKGRNADLNLSVYNAYNRHNATAYYYSGLEEEPGTIDSKGEYHPFKKYKVSFFPLIPTVSYKVYFD